MLKTGRGLTLIELLMVIAVTVLLAVLGAAPIGHLVSHWQVRSTLDKSQTLVRYAREQALASGQPVWVAFRPGRPWCLAVTQQWPCDCLQANDCQFNQRSVNLLGQANGAVSLSAHTFAPGQALRFDGLRGFSVGHAGRWQFSRDGVAGELVISNHGRVRRCGVDGAIIGLASC
ncbi:GspH/FimT family pseudopilin [Aestuariibacter halophilus]|uniref:Type II secretion system protein H n=1 Tax=Fluctibacter halophilus TaxID=226011 RepID=A0ABS8G283_9ALTE|nr:GspH/FimT family pseudopilin [Aestuariibacter halophilus]MCC2614650.1 GspH/FimT family pseudopilin [Aestuariibacter halophilus]